MVKKFSKVVGNWSVCDVVLLTAFGMFICEGEHLLSLRWSCLFFRCAVKCSASLYYFVKFVYFFLIKGLLIEKFLKVTKFGLGNIAFKIWFKIRKLHLCEAKAIIKKEGNLMKFNNIGGQFSVFTVTQSKIKLQTIWYRKSRILEIKEDK